MQPSICPPQVSPSWRGILKDTNFEIGESSTKLFLVNLYLLSFIWSMVNLERACALLFYYFVYLQVNLDLEKNQLDESSPNFIFAGGKSFLNCFGQAVNWWWILTQRFLLVTRSEHLRISSRCRLTPALRTHLTANEISYNIVEVNGHENHTLISK